jgi:hypothetical protein
MLTLYVVERWLARLSRSAYADDFVLKGGILLAAFGERRRQRVSPLGRSATRLSTPVSGSR